MKKDCKPQTTVFFCCNDIPKIDPNDVYEKLIPFSLKSKFVEEEITPELLRENPFIKRVMWILELKLIMMNGL